LISGLVAGFCAPAQTEETDQQKADQAYQAGMKLVREKRYKDALTEFKLVEHYTPQLPQGYSGEGIALALMGEPEAAVQVLRKAIDLDPSFWVARRELGIIYWQLNERDQASQELYKIAEQFPTDAVVNALLGQYEFANRHYGQAAALLAKAPGRVDADPDLALMEAQALLETGQTTPAGEKLESLRLRVGLTPQQTFRLAWLLGQAKHSKQAIDTFQSLPPDFPDPFDRGNGIALAYYGEHQYSQCVATLGELKSRGLTKPELYSLWGIAQEDAGNTLEAYETFRQGIYKFPKDDQNYLNAATLSARHKNYDVAEEILTSGVKLISDDYKLLFGRGVVFSMERKLPEAEADYRRALEVAPQEGTVYAALGVCYEDQNKFDQAAEILREGIRRQPQDVHLYYFLVDLLFRTGIAPGSPAYDQALSTVEASLRLDPDFALTYLQRARLKLLANQTESAIADLEHARALEPDSETIIYQLAVAYRRGGRTHDADKMFALIAEARKKQDAEWQHLDLMNIMIRVSESSR